MWQVKSIGLTLMLFLVITGCGESFRGQNMASTNSYENNSTDYFSNNGFRNSNTSLTIDQKILINYSNELQGRESQTISLTNAIKALDFSMTANTSSNMLDLKSEIVFSCNSSKSFSRSINASVMQSGQVVSLGNQANHSIRVQCTNSNCSDVVAAISLNDNFNNATVLVGMAVNSRVDNSLIYLSRNVNLTPYFAAFNSAGAYRQNNGCPVKNQTLGDKIVGVIQEEVSDYIVDEAEKFLKNLFN